MEQITIADIRPPEALPAARYKMFVDDILARSVAIPQSTPRTVDAYRERHGLAGSIDPELGEEVA